MGRRTSKNWDVFSGKTRHLIVAIDVGTTFSGAAYSILQPGEVPKIYDVGSFPGQQAGFHKVPSTVLYSPSGSIIGIGSETSTERIKAAASHVGAYEARWWKMALKRAENPSTEGEDMEDYILIPPGKSAQDIFSDYLSWMMKCTESFIAAKYRGGEQLLEETRKTRTIVLTHPNGWEGAQQAAMRAACIEAGIVDKTRAKTVRFVSEAEASLTFALASQTMSSWTQAGSQIVIVDAGGGTIDITSYAIESVSPLISVSETSVPRCLMAGAINVDRLAADLIAEKLEGTRWDNTEDLSTIVDEFTRIVKHTFSNQKNPCVIKIGPSIENDERIGIRKGMLVLEWDEVAALFQPSIEETVGALREIFSSMGRNSQKRVALVGGFSENNYFRESVASALSSDAIVAKPDNATSKAVANGAVAWAIDSVVTSRVSKVWYGISCAVPYNRHNKEHAGRERDIIYSADGKQRLPNGFHSLLAKGEAQSPDKEAVAEFSITKSVGEHLDGAFDLIAYRGDGDAPCFIEDDNGFETICRLEVNLERIQNGLPIRTTGGRRYRRVKFQIHAYLSDTELKARWVWNEQAVALSGEVHTVFLDELEHFTRKAASTYRRPTRIRTVDVPVETVSSPSIASFNLQENVEAYRDEEPETNAFPTAPQALRSSDSLNSAPSPGLPISQEQLEQFARAFFAMQTQEEGRQGISETPPAILTPSDVLGLYNQPSPVQRDRQVERVAASASNIPGIVFQEDTPTTFQAPHQHICSDVKVADVATLSVNRPSSPQAHPVHLSSKPEDRDPAPDDEGDYSPPPAYVFLGSDPER